MFVPVGCSECGKRFQVEREQLGQVASCPWCQARVVALPVAAAPEPLPLPLPEEAPAVVPVKPKSAPKPPRRIGVGCWLLTAALCILLGGGTFAFQRYRSGGFTSLAMQSSLDIHLASCESQLECAWAERRSPLRERKQFTWRG